MVVEQSYLPHPNGGLLLFQLSSPTLGRGTSLKIALRYESTSINMKILPKESMSVYTQALSR